MIDQIKSAVKAIGETPWNIGKQSPNGLQNIGRKGVMVCQAFTIEDATLIANAPTFINYLLTEHEALQKRVQELEQIEARHNELLAIMRRAEKVARQSVEERVRLKMDENGNLMRIEEEAQ